ncbi:hypothetical protein GE09DRAFT_283905 [Coniochaeta sp. 2T2.1]|nr:hypothetical protein GE09DRAFT_283905 [Coniochaeta sp. 2T2.1]
MAPSPPQAGSDALSEMGRMVSTAMTLISQLEPAVTKLGSDNNATASMTMSARLDPAIDALAVARDSATLIKAHATKISLFIINKPFTPTAITKVLRELVSGPLPGLASAAQLCDPKRYTLALSGDLAWRCGRVFKELKELLSRIPTDGQVLSDAKKNSAFGVGAGKGSVATTGVLWSACDDVITLANLGVVGYLCRKVEQFRDTIQDIIEEMTEWKDETSDDDEDDEDDDDEEGGEEDVDDEAHGSADEDDTIPHSTNGAPTAAQTQTTQEMLDDIMNAHTHIPRDDPDRIRPRVDSCLRRLRLTVLFHQASLKRRFKTLPLPLLSPAASSSDGTIVTRVDEVMKLLKRLPERFGSTALAFYELDVEQIDSLMDMCFIEGFAAAELLLNNWKGEEDEFTAWALKYQVEIKRA